MTIERFAGTAIGRSRAVAYERLAFAVETAADTSDSLRGQTEQTLAQLDKNLADLGTDKSKLLSATPTTTPWPGRSTASTRPR